TGREHLRTALLDSRLLDRVVLALQARVLGFLLLGAAKREKRRPEHDGAHRERFIVLRRFVEAAGDLARARLDARILRGELLAAVRFVLHRRDVKRCDIFRCGRAARGENRGEANEALHCWLLNKGSRVGAGRYRSVFAAAPSTAPAACSSAA